MPRIPFSDNYLPDKLCFVFVNENAHSAFLVSFKEALDRCILKPVQREEVNE